MAKKNRVFGEFVYPIKTNLDVQKLTDLSCLKNREKKHQKIFYKTNFHKQSLGNCAGIFVDSHLQTTLLLVKNKWSFQGVEEVPKFSYIRVEVKSTGGSMVN